MPSALFQTAAKRETLMNEIDYVNATTTFVAELEAGTRYSTPYFTL